MLKINSIKPVFNKIVTSCNTYDTDRVEGGIIVQTKGTVKEYQTVVAVGPMVRGIEVGDTVFINPNRYAVMKHKAGSLQDGVIKDNPVIGYNFDIVEIEGVNHLYLQDSDIKFVAEIEEFNENPLIYTEKPEIIV